MSQQAAGTTIEKEEIERIFQGFAIAAEKQISTNLPKPKKKVIVIAGPTACGKSDFAMKLAKEINGEIISADSMQIYRGMDVGSAKASKKEREEIPHHLIDIRDVKDTFNVVDFYYEARTCCQQILARGAVPIFVGGSGFYLHSLVYGPPSGPPSVPEVRKQLEEEMERMGPEAMYMRLQKEDPIYANSISKNDRQKIIRAFEIIRLTGKSVSKMAWKGRRKPQNYDFRCWFLYRPREQIYHRIEKRCDKMITEGFLDEVQALEAQGIRLNTSASQAIGYRQALEYLQSPQTRQDYEHFMTAFKQASRNYAKRQLTWFRNEPLFRWLDMDLHDTEVAMDMVIQDYQASL